MHLAAAKPFVLITGGAGVGKTTVLKALYDVYDRAGIAVTQLALAGRAAKRMQEATGRPASTIANFLRTAAEGNLWDRGLQNGSLGVVVQVDDEPRMLTNEDGKETGLALAWVDWDDGVRRPIVEDMLDDLELGYAITVHKAQGSQWPRVIVPLTGHRLLDRTLVYTAVTRAQRQVLLVGDEAAAKAAVEGLPRAQARQVALDLILCSLLSHETDDAATD